MVISRVALQRQWRVMAPIFFIQLHRRIFLRLFLSLSLSRPCLHTTILANEIHISSDNK